MTDIWIFLRSPGQEDKRVNYMRSFPFDRFSWKIRLPLEAKTLLSLTHIINLCSRFLAVNFSWNIPKNALNVLIIITCIQSLASPPCGIWLRNSFQFPIGIVCENSWLPPKRSVNYVDSERTKNKQLWRHFSQVAFFTTKGLHFGESRESYGDPARRYQCLGATCPNRSLTCCWTCT